MNILVSKLGYNPWQFLYVGLTTWICFFGDFLLSTMVNHHVSPPFGRIVLGHFFLPHRRVANPRLFIAKYHEAQKPGTAQFWVDVFQPTHSMADLRLALFP